MSSMKINDNYQTIFYNGNVLKDILFDNLPVDFIKGFLFACQLKNGDTKTRSNIITDVTIDMNDLIIKDPYIGFPIDEQYMDQDPTPEKINCKFKLILKRLGIIPNKIYYGIVDDFSPQLIQFDSIEYISGVETYSSWMRAPADQLRMVALFRNLQYHHLNVEYHFQFDWKERIKTYLIKFAYEAIVCIIMNYLIVDCNHERFDRMNCITKHWGTKSCFGCGPGMGNSVFTAKVSIV